MKLTIGGIMNCLALLPLVTGLASAETMPLIRSRADAAATMALFQGRSAAGFEVPELGQGVVVRDVTDPTPLMLAARAGDRREAARLLAEGASPNDIARGRHPAGGTALVVAAGEGHLDVVNLLLERGADPELADDAGRTPLQAALMRRRPAVVAALAALSPVENIRRDPKGDLPLTVVTEVNDSALAAALLADPRVDVNALGGLGMTPLGLAARNESIAIIKLLLDRPEIEVNLVDAHGMTALDHLRAGRLEPDSVVHELLVDAGAKHAVRRRAKRSR